MRLQYIFTYLRNRLPLVAVVACLWLASGCSDELNVPGGSDVPDGLPAVVTLKLDLGEMTPVSRADVHDKQINSLWVAVYNVHTGARTGLYTSDKTDSFNADHDYKNITLQTLSGESYIVAVANYNLRYATSGPGQTPVLLSEVLDGAKTWQDYCDIAVFFDEKGQSFIDVPANALVMSGYYVESSNAGHTARAPMSSVKITPDSFTPAGAIHLRRMISQIKFNVNFDKETISSCRISSWSVSCVPSNAWLHERTTSEIADGTIKSAETDMPVNSFDTRIVSGTPGFNKTEDFATVTANSAFSYSFDFWMLENKRTGTITRVNGDDEKTLYRKREKEYKNDDGTNTGKFVSLVNDADSSDPNNNATYVTFHVVMEMKVDENGAPFTGNKRRIVETDYTVHLGYVKGTGGTYDFNDFNALRNSRYTYNVTITNVNNVLVEALKDEEPNPGVEGFVSDISDKYIELDAHYGVFNIELTAENLNSFSFYMEVPTMEGNTLYIRPNSLATLSSDEMKYVRWVEFRPTTRESVIAEYKPRTGTNSDGRTFDLTDLVNGLSNSQKSSYNWYTVYINEYVYEDRTDGNESGSVNWKKYVNKPDRRVWINVTTEMSADGNSIYNQSKYAFSQKSIQCYYDVNNSDTKSAIGAEHRNETLGLALRNTFNPRRNSNGNNLNLNTSPGRNDVAGRFNVAQYIAGSSSTTLSWSATSTNNRYKWETYVSKNTLQDVPAVNNQGLKLDKRTEYIRKNITAPDVTLSEDNLSAVKKYDPSESTIEAISACLNRNRDLNGNGRIDAGELRWFVPTSAQYVRLILGRQSLEDPLLNPVGLTQLSDATNNMYNSRFLFYTSNGKILWAMEGTSLGEYRNNKNGPAPWDIRCVRNLGSDMTQINATAANSPAFKKVTVNGRKIVDMTGYDAASLRQEAFVDRSIPVHHINDQRYNRSYRAFEYKNEVINLNTAPFEKNGDYEIKDKEPWSTYIARVNPCDSYNTNGESGWRLPNQKEMAILAILDNISSGPLYQVGCSFSYFDVSGFVPGANPKNPTGELTSFYHHEMKILASQGTGTQWGFLTNDEDNDTNFHQLIRNGSFGFRCVRDYTGSLK